MSIHALNSRQLTAIHNPCSRARQAIHSMYFDRIERWSTIVTVNK